MEVKAFQKYPAYKDSGVEWLGEIPEGWMSSRLGSMLLPVSERNSIDLPLLSITREKGVILRDLDNEDENHNFIPDDLSNYKVLRKGQFGMNKMKAWQGSYGISQFDGIVSPAYFVFKLNEVVDPAFFHKAIRSRLYISFFGSASDGVRIGQWDLSKPRMKEISFFFPPLSEQTAIAHFLDTKTAQIDRAIAQKEKLIALLKERKQIVIQQAVTKGLDKTVKMKHSGVEWIGEIPEHWEVKTLKRLVATHQLEIQDGNHGESYPKESEFTSVGVPFIKPRDFNNGIIYWDTSDKLPKKRCETFRIGFGLKGDILMVNRGGSIGKIAHVEKYPFEYDFFIINPQVTYIRAKGNLFSRFMYYITLSKQFEVAVDQILGHGSTFPFLGLANMEKFEITIPPMLEQEAITSYIESQSAKIDKAIVFQEQQIEKLKEYKAVLVDSAVTGKIKIY